MESESYKTKITDHKIHLLSPKSEDDHTVANCSVVINDCINISGMRIIHLNGRFAVKWPSNPYHAGSRHLAYPTQKLFREYVEDSLISRFEKIIGNEKTKALMGEMESLKELRMNAIKAGKEDLSNAYWKAIEHINFLIQDI